jgi:hypothetical protein
LEQQLAAPVSICRISFPTFSIKFYASRVMAALETKQRAATTARARVAVLDPLIVLVLSSRGLIALNRRSTLPRWMERAWSQGGVLTPRIPTPSAGQHGWLPAPADRRPVREYQVPPPPSVYGLPDRDADNMDDWFNR